MTAKFVAKGDDPISAPTTYHEIARFADLLKCPSCGRRATFAKVNKGVFCQICERSFSAHDDVIDFVDNSADTALNVDSYDQQKNFSVETSRSVFRHLTEASGGAIGESLGVVLEVGAGTGLLTVGMLDDGGFDRAIITDISHRMLARCRRRVASSDKVLFATYSGREPIFAEDSFDLCIANSVLHHIAEYQAFLADMAKALRPGGVAVFVEPSAPYHNALSLAMMDSLCAVLADGSASAADPDVKTLAAWISDVRFRLAFQNNVECVRALEDKYIFSRENLIEAGLSAGFNSIDIRPNFVDPTGNIGLASYLGELGISSGFASNFLPVYTQYARNYFGALTVDDRTGMYVCVFRRT
jgi:ubiquinone/menaquinone biosynthesis C-methylase UbiE